VASTIIGQRLGDYEVVARVGTGGMGAVFEAKHPVIGKRVAVKVLHPAFAKDAKALERFVNEARVVNTIGHPAVVDIFSFGKTSEGMPYFVMEFLRGKSLHDVLAKEKVLSISRALGLIEQLLDVLAKAHGANIIHRDLKPQNLFIEEGPSGGRLRVLDFGIAKSLTPEIAQQLTGSAILGTPGYMAPEQINSDPVSAQTDLYSVGALLFELVTGRQAFHGSNVGQLLLKALHEDAPKASSVSPGIPAVLDAFIARLMSKDPARRPSSALGALEELKWLRQGLEEEGSAPTRVHQVLTGDRLPAAKPKPFVPGLDDRPTGEVRAHKPKVDMHDPGMRTEPAFEPPVARKAPLRIEQLPEPSASRSAPIKLDGPPTPQAPVMSTTVDRQMVQRIEAQAPSSRWLIVVVILLLIVVGAAALYLVLGD
jgi:serine/threonine-protein kinase